MLEPVAYNIQLEIMITRKWNMALSKGHIKDNYWSNIHGQHVFRLVYGISSTNGITPVRSVDLCVLS